MFQSYLMQKADIAAYHPGKFLDIVVTRKEAAQMQREYPGSRITQTEEQSQLNLHSSDRDIAGYRSYTTMLTELQQIAAAHPDICRLYNLGDTWGKQYFEQGVSAYQPYQFSIWAMKVSDNPDSEEDEPGVYYVGAHHAREPLGVETTMKILHQLVDNYGSNTEMTNRVNNTQVWFIPLVNPDGHQIVWDNTDTWWRKNIRDNNSNHTFDSWYQYGYGDDGVDLNRNYGVYWGSLGASDTFADPTYHGTNAFSEPETTIIKNFLDSHHFVAGISYHTYAGLVLYPTGYYVGNYAIDNTALAGLASEMLATLPGYSAEPEFGLYPSMGGMDDYSYAEHGNFAYTIELAGDEFIPPANQVTQIVNQNMNAAFLLMDRINHSAYTGIVVDSLTDHPMVAKITIPDIDNFGAYRKPYVSDVDFGRFYRILPLGNHPVVISAYGYQTKTITNTSAVDNEQTNLGTISMVPAQPASLIGRIMNGSNLQGIMGAAVQLLGTPLQEVFTDSDGYFTLPATYAGTYTIDIYRDSFDWMRVPVTLNPGENHMEWQLQVPFMEDTFETDQGWITTGTWAITNSQHVSGSHCLTDSPGNYYTGSAYVSTAQYPNSVNLQDTPNISVSFMVKSSMFPNYDYVNFQCSKNGVDWQTIDAYYNTFNWTQKRYNLNEYLGGNLFLRFQFVTQAYGDADGIYIDDFKIYMYSTVTENPPSPLSASLFLMQNCPNPFNPETMITYSIPQKSHVNLNIYNIRGQLVKQIVTGNQESGVHSIRWDGKDKNGNGTASGVYFYRLDVEGQHSITKKMILMK